MSDVWRICVVEGDASLNQSLVNSLRKDGYVVLGAVNSSDAMRILWSEEYDVVICDLNLPGADGFELLHWLRAYRSNVRPVVLGPASSTADSVQRLQALESGAISYIEKPVDLRVLKDELRRLLQPTGFTASLDSFDLLDVIQIITLSRKSITLLINTGLEERGTLCFQNGELSWAEYGALRGEEAFFALAAHKNGTVTQQQFDGPFVTNVAQPLSRLILQALQYRTKYANTQQSMNDSLGQGPVSTSGRPSSPGLSSPGLSLPDDDIDDSPFLFTSDGMQVSNPPTPPISPAMPAFSAPQEPLTPMEQLDSPVLKRHKEWWEITGHTPSVTGGLNNRADDVDSSPTFEMDLRPLREALNPSQASPLREGANMSEEQASQLPSWLTEQLTPPSRIPTPSSPQMSSPAQMPVSPMQQSGSGDKHKIQAIQASQVPFKTTDDLSGVRPSSTQMQAFAPEVEERRPSSTQWSREPQRSSSTSQHRLPGQSGVFERPSGKPNPVDPLHENNPMRSSSPSQPVQRQVAGKNYAAVVSALQTLGYSIPGFVAAAVIDIDSHLIAQVAIDDADISQIWQLLSIVQRSALNALQSAEWGSYEETVMTTASRHVLMRVIGTDKKAFLVLITTREASFTDSLEIMANVEGAISAALR